MYRYDVTPDAAYKGLKIVVWQAYHLKEQLAAIEAREASEARSAPADEESRSKDVAYSRAHPTKDVDNSYQLQAKQRQEDQDRKDKLHQESVDYYNKIHPYGEGSTDLNGHVIH